MARNVRRYLVAGMLVGAAQVSCGGTVHDYYPQGWHGWAQTAGGCC